jgi:GntR family transcriptional regulator
MIQSGPLPKHLQVTEMLIREIAAGHIPDGSRLPPERKMAADLNIAVGTLRKALAELEAKHLLERIQGSGNYVRARPVPESIYAFFRLELADGGGLPTARVIDVSRQPKPQDAPAFGDGAIAHRIRRLRYLDSQPIAVEEIWLDGRFISKLDAAELVDSLYFFYKKTLGLVITRITDRVGVGPVPDWAPQAFPLRRGAAAGFIERLGWGQEETAAEFSRTWFHPELARYTIRLQ